MRPFSILFAVLLAAAPALATGAERLLTLDNGVEMPIWVFTPKQSGPGPWPLAVMIPGGSGQDYTVKSQFWLGREMTARGWVIAVPFSPEGKIFVGNHRDNISQVIKVLQQDSSILPGKALLLGVSSGGSSALEIASKNPAAYYGVVAVPGRLKQTGPLPAMDGLPVFLRIAQRDFFRWHKLLPDMTQRLESAGARVNAALVPDARHIIRIDWSELDAWLGEVTGAPETLVQVPPGD